MPISVILGVIEALTPAQWLAILGMLPTIYKTLEDGWAFGKEAVAMIQQVVGAIDNKMETPGVSHSDAASQLRTEGFAVPGWSDQATRQWMDNVTVPEGGFTGG